jgi:hypothetical protein
VFLNSRLPSVKKTAMRLIPPSVWDFLSGSCEVLGKSGSTRLGKFKGSLRLKNLN